MEEIWKDIENYEGLYQVSTIGRVRSVSRWVCDSIGRSYYKKGKILSARISSQTGYPTLNLMKDGVVKTHSVHRLVAEAFIPNPKNLPCINHKDESRDNNYVANLEWCSYGYNNTYGSAIQRRTETLRKGLEGKHKTIYQFTKNGVLVAEFSCGVAELEDKLGYCISTCLVGNSKTAHGYVFTYDDKFSYDEDKPKRHQKFVIKRDADGNEVTRYKSVSEAARENGFERHAIGRCSVIDGYYYEVEKKENEFIPVGHKGPRPDLVGRNTKTVYQYTKDGQFVAEYKSIKDAAIAMGDRKRSSDITNCAKGNIPSAFGFDWRYKKKQTWK